MDWFHQLTGLEPGVALPILLNLILIESLLSVDNAAVLATMVMDLPENQRSKALKYGIFGAYFFRGLCLVFAARLVEITFLKLIGGLYLLYLAIHYFYTKSTPSDEDDLLNKKESRLYKMTLGALGLFWATVVQVEVMDIMFSIDNVIAVVAFTDNIYIICTGVFIGILAMRFVAQSFVTLMEKYPFLESTSFVVIAILGLKLCVSYMSEALGYKAVKDVLDSHEMELYFSIFTAALFIAPVLSSLAFNFPKRNA